MENFPPNGNKQTLCQLIKNNKQLKENYRPLSLLLICGKILERLIYNMMFEFFTENELNFPNQSRFKPRDTCINQLLFFTRDIYQSFGEGLKTRGVFLDISKAYLINLARGSTPEVETKWNMR